MPIILVGESLAEVERHLAALKKLDALKTPRTLPVQTTAPIAPTRAESQRTLNRKVQRLKYRATRTTGKVWDLVVAAAKFPRGKEFTLADLAQSMGEKLPKVRSWHRILARPSKRLNVTVFARVEGAERPTRFTMPLSIRKAVNQAMRAVVRKQPGAGKPVKGRGKNRKAPMENRKGGGTSPQIPSGNPATAKP